MPTLNDLKKSRFITKNDVARPILVTIKGWHGENVAMFGAPKEEKFCLDFEETEKPLVLNSTKGQIIAQICGTAPDADFAEWVGFRIVLFHDPTVTMQGKGIVGGIGVRAPRIAPAPIAPRPRPPTPPPPPVPEPAPPRFVPPNFTEGPAVELPEEDDVPF